MKLLLCIALIVAGVSALTDDQKKKLDEISSQCKAVTGVSQELIDKARAGDLVEDPKLKNQILCVAKKVHLATDTGEVNLELLKAKVKKVAANDAEVDNLVKKCVVKKDKPEDTAFEVFKCLYSEKPHFSVVD